MPLIVLRCVFLIVAMGISGLLINLQLPAEGSEGAEIAPWITFVTVMAVAGIIIFLDLMVPTKRIDTISSIYFGMLIGLILTALVSVALTPLRQIFQDRYVAFIDGTILFLGAGMCYLCISFLLQTKDDFRFIIPYVEFSKEVKGLRPYVLDTSAVIDGRIADVVETNLMDNQLIMPRFVLAELQGIADSSDKLRRSRGRRGLDILNKLQNSDGVDLQIFDRELKEFSGQPVDMKLVLLAKHIDGKVVTGDYNLNKVARLHNVQVINLNDLANALKPVYMPGEKFVIRIVKSGEAPDQGVGYLDDGTMIVVQDGRNYISQSVEVTVTSVLQTSAGRMIFSKFERLSEEPKKKHG